MTVPSGAASSVFQLGYVSDDLERGRRWFESTFGARGFRLEEDVRLRGFADGKPDQTWTVDVAFLELGAVQVEILKPRTGQLAIYETFLQPDRPATLHHVGIRVALWKEAEERAASFGTPWALKGSFPGVCTFGYLDSCAQVGHYTEFVCFEPAVWARIEAGRA